MVRKKVKCGSCGFDISMSNISKHKDSKMCLANQNGRIIKPTIIVPEDLKCTFCGRGCKNDNSFRQHYTRCLMNPNKIEVVVPSKTEKWLETRRNGTWKVSNQYLKAKELGLPKPEISDETRKKLSDASKNQDWTEERRKKQSESMIKAVENNPDSYTKNNVCGRVKLVEYNGAKLKGSWELKTAQWLDSQEISWIHECSAFPYVWEGKDKKYYPDFFLAEHDLYLEVKGYKTDRDVAKWEQFPHKLIIIDKTIIHKLDEMTILDLKKE